MVDMNADESVGGKERRRCWADPQLPHHLDLFSKSGRNGLCRMWREVGVQRGVEGTSEKNMWGCCLQIPLVNIQLYNLL